MRIISKFNDYYDSVQTFEDTDSIYIRKQIELEIKKHNKIDSKNNNHISFEKYFKKYINDTRSFTTYKNYNSIFYYCFIIGFCGKFYPCIKLDGRDIKILNTSIIEYTYSLTDFLKYFKKTQDKKDYKLFINNKSHPFYRYYSDRFNIVNITKFLNNPNNPDNTLFFKFKTPCFIIDLSNNKLIVNPCLKDYNFMKVFDPFLANQEIETYINGVLGDINKPISIISDKDMLIKKGFNDMSFKTYKGTKKPRRRKNWSI